MLKEKSSAKVLKLKSAIWVLLIIGSVLFAVPTMVSINGVGALFSYNRISFLEFSQSLIYGSLDEFRALFVKDDTAAKTTFNLDVSMLDLLRHFENLVEEARSQQMLTKKTKDWISADLHIDGEKYPVKFRLRGDLPRHYSGKKISLRFKITGSKLWNNRKDINLILPQHTGYFVDIFMSKLAGFLSLPNNCVFRGDPATHTDFIRPVIPEHPATPI